MDRIFSMIIRQVVRQLVGQGVKGAMRAGGRAMKGGMGRKGRAAPRNQAVETEIEQDPALTQRRRLHPDEEKGDEILYPTDDYTDGMQPRR